MTLGVFESSDKDKWESFIEGLPFGLYLYYIDDSMFNTNRVSILGNCPSIQSIIYTPFIEPSDLGGLNIPYDVKRFGSIDKENPELWEIPQVLRILEHKQDDKKVGFFNPYIRVIPPDNTRDWRNESKLYNYPYSFALLTDHMNTPFEIKYHNCPDNCEVFVKQSLSDKCSYGVYVKNYKNDTNGIIEAMVSGDGNELPCTSSAYNQWFAQNKNQVAQATKANLIESAFNVKKSDDMFLPSMMGSLSGANLNPMSWLGTGANMWSTGVQNKLTHEKGSIDRQNIIGSVLAQKKDLNNTPNTVVSMGSNIMYGLKKGDKRLDLIRYGVTDEYAKRIGDYFALYGYKQNQLMSIKKNIATRYYYNYIKTVGLNTRATGIPKDRQEKMKQIFDNGVTLWHCSNKDVIIGDYSKDNREV